MELRSSPWSTSFLRLLSQENTPTPKPFGLGLKSKIIVQWGATFQRAFRETSQFPCVIIDYRCNPQKLSEGCLKLRCFHLKSQLKTYMELCKWQKNVFWDPAIVSVVRFLLLADTFHVSFVFLADGKALGSLRHRLGNRSLREPLAMRILRRDVVKMSSWKQSKSCV